MNPEYVDPRLRAKVKSGIGCIPRLRAAVESGIRNPVGIPPGRLVVAVWRWRWRSWRTGHVGFCGGPAVVAVATTTVTGFGGGHAAAAAAAAMAVAMAVANGSVDVEADGDEVSDWDGRKYPECPPYKGRKGQAWETFIRDFGSAMSMKEALTSRSSS